MDVKKITLQREQTRLQTPEKIRLTPNSDGRMWKMYTRLNEMSDNGRLQLNKEYDELCPFTEHGEQLQVPVSLSRVVSPHSGDIRCHCFQAALKGVEKVWPNKTQNRSPNLISEMQDRRFLNEIHHKMEENRQYQYPMSTVVVRWHYTPDDYACDPLTILEDLIAKCGPVTSSSPVSTNSMVIYTRWNKFILSVMGWKTASKTRDMTPKCTQEHIMWRRCSLIYCLLSILCFALAIAYV